MNDDRQVVNSVLNGKEEDFCILVNKYYPKFLTLCLKLSFDRCDIEDTIQDIFIKVYLNLYKYNSKWMFSTWVYRIAINTIRDIRKRKHINTTGLNLELITENNNFEDNLVNNCCNKEIIKDMFNSLDEKLKMMMILHYYEELPFKEIGKIFGMSEGAVKMKLHRTRDKLYRSFSKAYSGGAKYEM